MSQHIFQTPKYTRGDGTWSRDFMEEANQSPELTWDLGSFLSTLSYGYSLGNATLFEEIRRQPWLGKKTDSGGFEEMPIPPHQLLGGTAKQIGRRLFDLMCTEAENACRDREQVYILLSGGLDSRIVAGVIKHLQRERRIDCKVSAVTWGIKNCRDVYYGKCVAERLNYEWFHAELNEEEYWRNIPLCAKRLGAAVSPVHLHRMNWFEQVDSKSLVLAGSLGNMIGRGQITSRSMLEVLPIKPFNYLGLLKEDAAHEGLKRCNQELLALRERAGQGLDEYVYREHEQAAHFSRGMLCQTMSIINDYCDVYQMLSAPEVYSFMWSRHPAVRTDDVYAEVLELVGREVASVPWSRTNKALRGTDQSVQKKLSKRHNDYPLWTHNYLNSNAFDLDSLMQRMSHLDFLNHDRLRRLFVEFKSNANALPTEAAMFSLTLAWFISLDMLVSNMPGIQSKKYEPLKIQAGRTKAHWSRSLRRYFANKPIIRNNVAKIRRSRATKKFLKSNPVQDDPGLG